MLFYLSSNWRHETISEDLNKSKFSRGPASIELYKKKLQMFKVRGPILQLIILVLIISSNLILDSIYKQPKVSRTLLEEGFKLILEQKIFGGLVP